MKEKNLKQQKGQSIVLVAAAMVLLVLFVALSVDASNAYYHRRTAQNAADGGALAGASQMATSINKLQNKDDKLIDIAINRFAELNGIEDTDPPEFDEDNTNVEGWYVNFLGNRIPDADMIGSGKVPAGAVGVEVITHIRAPTYFGGIFGLRGLPITARAVSLLRKACEQGCVVPITTQQDVLQKDDGTYRTGECFNIWNESKNTGEEATPGAYGWVNWTWQQSMCALDSDRGCPKVDQKQNGCDADTLPDNLNPENCTVDVRVGDWVNSTSGVVNASAVDCWLLYYLGTHDEYCDVRTTPKPISFVIPIYDYTNVGDAGKLPTCLSLGDPTVPDPDDPDFAGGGLHYHVAGFARMQLLGFDLSQGGGTAAGDTGESCVTLGNEPHLGNRITAKFLEWVVGTNPSAECADPLSTIYAAPTIFE